jgi:tetratricopeptide (TPR) repeat protein
MDLQMQAELLSFLSRPPARIIERDISIQIILQRLKNRPPARAWALGDYEEGISNAHNIISKVEQAWQQEHPSLLAELHAWTASLHILRGAAGDQEEGEKHIQKAYALLPMEEIGKPFTDLMFPDALFWYAKAITALTYRNHGYLKRMQGFMQEAVDYYQKAAVLLREIDLRIEMATVMNDMGFAQAERGLWGDGRSNVKDALELRRELGPRIPVALSLNTLAAIDVREGQYPSARQNSEKALSIFRAFSHQRGIGMALVTLAEATRRFASVAPLLSNSERIKLLREARDHTREASIIFGELGEVSRRVEALIELGTACRDWVRLLMQSPQPSDDPGRLIRDSQQSLREAASLARDAGLTYRYVDALVNLAWLEYYLLDKGEEISDKQPSTVVIQDAERAFPLDAEIWKQPQVWAQKGKFYVLKGHLAFREYRYKRQKIAKGLPLEIQEVLKQVAENYALALELSSRFALDYQGIRQAKDGISDRLKQLNAAEMRVVCNSVHELYPQGSIIQAFLTNRALWQIG